jgi:hypothetical protein
MEPATRCSLFTVCSIGGGQGTRQAGRQAAAGGLYCHGFRPFLSLAGRLYSQQALRPVLLGRLNSFVVTFSPSTVWIQGPRLSAPVTFKNKKN